MKASLLCLLLLAILGPSSSKKIPRWWMKVAQKQGPNACVVEEIPNTNIEFWTECKYWLRRNICGRRTVIRFDCCEGFEQIEGEDGCTRVKPLRNVLDTAESLGATKWSEYIRESGLAPELTGAGAFTLFVPTNDAFDKLRRSLKSQMEAYRGNPENPIVLYHMVPQKIVSDDFGANVMVETRNQGAHIRINKYSNGMTTINCALLIRKDQQATNGVVHIIDSVLDPSVGIASNVADMVLSDGRFSVMAEILEKSGYVNVLRTMQDSITILAPSDEAFQKLPESRREKIINDRDARLALLQNHVIPHVICESAITGEHRVRTVSDKAENKLTFNCDIEGAYVENTKLRNNFNLGKNGIIHMIDDVLLPDRAKNLIELAESRQLVTFVELVRKAGLEETLAHTGDYTFFVPSELAWLEMDASIMNQARRDVEFAGQLIRFHGAYGRHLTNAISDNQAIMSLDEENPVRLQVWRKAMGVEDAKIEEQDLEAQNGVIHIINKVIVPSNQSAADILRNIRGKSFNTFLEAMEKVTKQSNILSLKPGDETFYTFFVPPDSAFRALDQAHLSQMMSDSSVVETVIKNHIAINMFPETSFVPGLIYTIEGMNGPFDIKKGTDGVLSVNGAKVSSSYMSSNGVIHITDRVFMPEESSYTNAASSSTRSSYSSGSQGSSSWSSSSSSSSSSSRRFSRKSSKSSRRKVTHAEDNDFEDILPAYPQGSVEAKPSRATRRKPSRWSLRRKASAASPLPSAVTTSTATSTSTQSSATSNHGGRRGSFSVSNEAILEENPSSHGASAAREAEIQGNSIDTTSVDNQGSYDSHRSITKDADSSSTSYTVSRNVISGVGLHESSSSRDVATSNIDDKDSSRETVEESSGSVIYSNEGSGANKGTSKTEERYTTGAEANITGNSGSSVSYLEDRYRSGIDYDLLGIVVGDNIENEYIEGRHKAGNDADLAGSSITSNLNTDDRYKAGIDSDLQGTVTSTKIQEDRYKAGIDADLHGSSSSVTREDRYKAGKDADIRGSYGSEGRYRSGIEGDLRNSFEQKWRAGIDSKSGNKYRGKVDHDQGRSTSEDRYRAGIDADLQGSSHDHYQGGSTSEDRYRAGIDADLQGSSHDHYQGGSTSEDRYRAGIDADLQGSSLDHYGEGSTSEDRYRAGIDADLQGSSHYSSHSYSTNLSGSRGSSNDLSNTNISPSISSGASGYDSTKTETRYIQSGGSLGEEILGANNLGSNNSSSHSSRTHTYTYSSEGTGGAGSIQTGGGSLTHDGSIFPILTDQSSGLKTTILSSSSTHKNTIGPVSTDTGKFSYVGHPYGKDVVGHGDNSLPLPVDGHGDNSMPLPILSGSSVSTSESRGHKVSNNKNLRRGNGGLRNSYNYENSYNVDFSGPRRGDTAVGNNENSGSDIGSNSYSSSSRRYSTGRRSSSIGNRKKYGITASTVVTGPDANSKSILRKTERKYTFPQAESMMPVSHLGMDGKTHSSLVSAYAFTGRDTEYADGSEFLEAKTPKETVITEEEAVRRKWRRKRHQRRGGRRRSGRGRSMRRQARRRQHKSKE